jgi:hypothetical protein
MIDILLRGIPTPITVSGGAGVATVDLQPAAGEIWIVAWAQGRHDDTSARVSGFTLHDGVTAVNIGPGCSIAAAICLPLFATNPDGIAGKQGNEWKLPLVLNATMHLSWTLVAITAGKIATIDALVYKYRGIGPWSNV